jgi:hypothetical protein
MKSLMGKFKRGSVAGASTIVDVRMKLAKVLNGRDGLDGMQTLFEEMDTDGDGTLSLEELHSGFAKFGVDLATQEVELLFLYLDADKSGDIDLNEFYQMQKNSIELHSIQEYLRRRSSTLHLASHHECENEDDEDENVSNKLSGSLSALPVKVKASGGVGDIAGHWQAHLTRTLEALDNGVRLDRSNSTSDNPKMQVNMKERERVCVRCERCRRRHQSDLPSCLPLSRLSLAPLIGGHGDARRVAGQSSDRVEGQQLSNPNSDR